METKPVFCSECGAKLTGSATFCASCGAKQEAVPAAEAAPAAAPENSLAAPKKASLSVFGLILTVVALGTTMLAIILYICQFTIMMGRDFSNIGMPLLRQNSLGMLTACVAPLFALVTVFTKNKKLATVGLIVAAASLGLQFIFSIVYPIVMRGGVPVARMNFILRPLNGESLFLDIRGLFRRGANTGRETIMYLLRTSSSLLYFLKNILAAVGCLVAAKKGK